jgi:hypothetical protein
MFIPSLHSKQYWVVFFWHLKFAFVVFSLPFYYIIILVICFLDDRILFLIGFFLKPWLRATLLCKMFGMLGWLHLLYFLILKVRFKSYFQIGIPSTKRRKCSCPGLDWYLISSKSIPFSITKDPLRLERILKGEIRLNYCQSLLVHNTIISTRLCYSTFTLKSSNILLRKCDSRLKLQ